MNSNSLEYEDVLYFDLQPNPMACTLGSVVMEWKQTLPEIWMLSDDWLMWYKHLINKLGWGGGGMWMVQHKILDQYLTGERGGSVVECRTPEREVRGSRPTAAVLCPWARHFTPRKYWLITQEAMAPSRHDWKIVDWDVKPQHNQPISNVKQSIN